MQYKVRHVQAAASKPQGLSVAVDFLFRQWFMIGVVVSILLARSAPWVGAKDGPLVRACASASARVCEGESDRGSVRKGGGMGECMCVCT